MSGIDSALALASDDRPKEILQRGIMAGEGMLCLVSNLLDVHRMEKNRLAIHPEKISAAEIEVRACRLGAPRRVQLSVIKHGQGIALECHQKVFEKFGQVNASQSWKPVGSGLGLTFCRMAIEAHGGRIGVESVCGEHTRFLFTLPVEEQLPRGNAQRVDSGTGLWYNRCAVAASPVNAARALHQRGMVHMPPVVGVSFRETGKVHYLNPGSLEVHEGALVVAETPRGIELGRVRGVQQPTQEEQTQPLRPIIRLATPQDCETYRINQTHEEEALAICADRVAKHSLPMRLLRAEYTLDRARVVFYFFAEGRVDFRELVKDLVRALRTRIELHQVGARDAAKLTGGFGRCGRELCCASWLPGFEPVSMKMAKEQDLTLNPTKFSGPCGKLMCCLRFEVDYYRESRRALPAVGDLASAATGQARVLEVNLPDNLVRVEHIETGVREDLPADRLFAATPEPCRDCAAPSGCPTGGANSSRTA